MQYYQFYTPGPQPFKRCILQLKKLPNGSPNHASQDEVTTTMSPPKKHTHTNSLSPPKEWPLWIWQFGWLASASVPNHHQHKNWSIVFPLQKIQVRLQIPKRHQKCSRKGMVLEVRVFIHFDLKQWYTNLWQFHAHAKTQKFNWALLGMSCIYMYLFEGKFQPVSFHWASYHLVVEHASARLPSLLWKRLITKGYSTYYLTPTKRTYYHLKCHQIRSRSSKRQSQIISWQHYIDTLKIYRRYCHVHVAFCGFRQPFNPPALRWATQEWHPNVSRCRHPFSETCRFLGVLRKNPSTKQSSVNLRCCFKKCIQPLTSVSQPYSNCSCNKNPATNKSKKKTHSPPFIILSNFPTKTTLPLVLHWKSPPSPTAIRLMAAKAKRKVRLWMVVAGVLGFDKITIWR